MATRWALLEQADDGVCCREGHMACSCGFRLGLTWIGSWIAVLLFLNGLRSPVKNLLMSLLFARLARM
eukprot:12935132-Prorocentrum_lima.AAC.1